MSNIEHFDGVSVVDGDIRVNIDFSRYEVGFAKAQAWIGEQVLQDCRALMPLSTGGLQQRSHTDNSKHLRDESQTKNGGRQVVFPGPYARFQYGGLVMVDPDTNSPWAKPGAKKVLTDRHLQYSRPEAVSHWFDEAKARNGEYWIKKVKEIATNGE